MITKGFVEELVGKTSIRVRIPVLDKVDYANSGSHFDDLSIATVCTLPSCSPNLQVGDVVFVGFEDNSRCKPVILGYLYSDQSSYYDIKLNSLDVGISARLSKDTTVGNVLPDDFNSLTDLQENIQDSLDAAQTSIDGLTVKIKENKESLAKKSAKLFDNSLKIDSNSSNMQLLAEKIGSVLDINKPTLFGRMRSISSKLGKINDKIGSSSSDQSIMDIIDNIKARIEALEESCKLVYVENNNDTLYHDSVNSDSYESDTSVAGELRTSQKAIDFIKSKEGFAEYAAWDYAQYSIGHGCHCGKNEYPNGITREQAHQLLIKELKTEFEPEIANLESSRSKKFTQNEWDAIVSFSFNVGTAWCSNYSYNIYKYVMLKQPYTDQEFKDCMRAWSHAGGEQLPGLVVRREEEADMYTKGIYP